MDYKTDITLNERDSLMDLLNLEKAMVKVYATALTEGTSKGYRTVVQDNFFKMADNQLDVFLLMTELGYAKVESAELTEIKEEKEKFSKIKHTLA